MIFISFLLSTLVFSAQAQVRETGHDGEYDEHGFKLPTPAEVFATPSALEPTCAEDFLGAIKREPKLFAFEVLSTFFVAFLLGWKVHRHRLLKYLLCFYLPHLGALAYLGRGGLKQGFNALLGSKHDVSGLANCPNLALFFLPALVMYNLGVLLGMYFRRGPGIKHQVRHLMQQKLGKSVIELAAKEAWAVTKKLDNTEHKSKHGRVQDTKSLKASMKTIVGAVLVADDKLDTSRKLKKRAKHGQAVSHNEGLFLKAIKILKSTSDQRQISPYDAIYCALFLKLIDPSKKLEGSKKGEAAKSKKKSKKSKGAKKKSSKKKKK